MTFTKFFSFAKVLRKSSSDRWPMIGQNLAQLLRPNLTECHDPNLAEVLTKLQLTLRPDPSSAKFIIFIPVLIIYIIHNERVVPDMPFPIKKFLKFFKSNFFS